MSQNSEERLRKLNSPEAEENVDRFERQLFEGRHPRIEDFAPADLALRMVVLEELVHVELEYCLKHGQQVALEDYWRRLPELLADTDVASRLRQTYERFSLKESRLESPVRATGNLPMPSSERPKFLAGSQLLFGVIALQNSFITREHLIAAFDAWIHDKSRSLSEILVARGALSLTHAEILDKLVSLFLEKHCGDVEQSLAALSSLAEVRPQLERLGDADLQANVGHIGRGEDQHSASTLIGTVDASRGRFRIVRPHALGGLGQVSVALDQELNREVALKEILPRHADNPVSRERFVLEAEITGGLEHPGIVPVYALGQAPNGRPFYAMRFIKGDSLKTAIEAYHHPDHQKQQDPSSRQLELRRLLGQFIDVCNAMDYAHSRGVLHRDLKPGNIMVGKYGETLVVDWGLAKVVDRPDVSSDENSLHPATALSSSGQTLPGSAIGTPAYMSPEQAAGDLKNIDCRSDVYSLGATLYHLLCGRPPFEKDKIADILAKIQRGDFPRPSTISPTVPPPLESICLKAMSLTSSDRYATPRALADELEHWLADEPVIAHSDSLSTQLSRWSRKHRGWVQAGSVSGILLLIFMTAAALIIKSQQNQTAKLAKDMTQLASTNARIADERKTLAETNQQLFLSERTAKTLAQNNQQLAEQHAASFKRSLAQNYFNNGARDYADGRLASALGNLTRSVAMTTPDNPFSSSYRRVLVDRAIQGGKLLVAPYRQEAISCVAINPEGTRIAVGSDDMTVRLLDAKTARPVAEPMRHEQSVNRVAFSADGKRVITVSGFVTIRIWDAATGASQGPPISRSEAGSIAGISPDGTRFVCLSPDHSARLFDSSSGMLIGEPMLHPAAIVCVVFSPDSSRLLTGCWDNMARIFDTKTTRSVVTPILHELPVATAEFSPDGARVVTSNQNSTQMWDVMTGRSIVAPMRPGAARLIAFSPDGSRVVTVDYRFAQIWDAKTGQPLGPPMQHDDVIAAIAFSPDGSRLVTGCRDMTARLWDAATSHAEGEPMLHPDKVAFVTFCGDGSQIVTTTATTTATFASTRIGYLDGSSRTDNAVFVWDATIGRPPYDALVNGVLRTANAFSPDGVRAIVVESDFKTLRLLDGKTGQHVGEPIRLEGVVMSEEFSPDGRRVLTCSQDKTARLWDATTGTPICEPIANVQTAAFNFDGSRIVTVNLDRTARLWDGITGLSLKQSMPHDDVPSSAQFSPDGAYLITQTHNEALVWDSSTARRVGAPLRHAKGFMANDAVFSPDGKMVALRTFDSAVRLWNLRTGEPIGQPMQHLDGVMAVAFSADGLRVATGSRDKSARVWNAKTGLPLSDPIWHDDVIFGVALSANGSRVVTSTANGAAILWDALTGQSLGVPVHRFGPSFPNIGFSPDQSKIVSRFRSNALSWDVTTPDFDKHSMQAASQTLELWTGVRADGDGNLRNLSYDEFDQIQRKTGGNDVLTRFQSQRHLRSREAYHLAAVADAEAKNDRFAALFHLRLLHNAQPNDVELRIRLEQVAGNYAADSGRYPEAAESYGWLQDARPGDGWTGYKHVTAALAAGDREKYLTAWKKLHDKFKDTTDGSIAGPLVTAYVASVPDPGLSSSIVRLAEKYTGEKIGWKKRVLGAARARNGEYDRALDDLKTESGAFPPRPWDYLFLALAYSKKGDAESALAAYQSAEASIESTNLQHAWSWNERVEVTVLQREIAQSLKLPIKQVPEGAELIRQMPASTTRQ